MSLQYYLTLFTCGVSAILLALVLTGLSIRHDEALQKYRTARWCLCVAFLVFGIANLFQVGMESGGKEEALTGVMALVIGSINAMMFSTVVHIFIRPEVVTKRNVMFQGVAILLLSTLLIVARFTIPLQVFYIVYHVLIGCYVLLLATYTYYFLKNYRVFSKQMLEFYEEEELLYRMRWIQWTFWTALAVGISALLLTIDSHSVNMLLTCLFTLYYLFITISFINYQQYAQLVVRAYEKTGKAAEAEQQERTKTENTCNEDAIAQKDIERITLAINEWVSQKKFSETDKSVEETASDLNVDSKTLRVYFTNHIGEDFRSWRNRIRVEEAKRLIDANPSIKIIEVMNLTGFNDRPYFYRIFQKITGMSVAEYRKEKAEGIMDN
jgi:YesN/AraC family two-component response regulator